jgi:hypothetical protein
MLIPYNHPLVLLYSTSLVPSIMNIRWREFSHLDIMIWTSRIMESISTCAVVDLVREDDKPLLPRTEQDGICGVPRVSNNYFSTR